MKKATSLYLDFVRFFAAAMVFLTHASYSKWSGGFLWQFQGLGPRAVDVFFVLSGFVIAFVTDGREADVRTYACSRLARIYSVAFPALILTLLFNTIGQSLDKAPYVSANDPGHAISLWAFAANLTFVNEVWNQHVVFGTNEPYWSLGFEVWYYIIFGLFLFGPRRWRWLCGLGALAVAGPKIVILFPLWLLGAWCYLIVKTKQPPRWLGIASYVGSLLGFALYLKFFSHDGAQAFDPLTFDADRFSVYLDNYATGLLFALHLIGFDSFGEALRPVLDRYAKPIRWVAGATFSLYLFHQPIIELLVAICRFPPASLKMRIIVFLGTPLIVLLLAELTERRKEAWRRLFSWGINRGRAELESA